MGVRFRLKQGKHYARANGCSVIVYLNGGTEKKTNGGHYLVAGDVIECYPEMLKYFMDKFEQIDPDPKPESPEVGLYLVAVDGGWNVVNSVTKQSLNDVPLTQEVAESIVTVFDTTKQLQEAEAAAQKPPETETSDPDRINVTAIDDEQPQYVDGQVDNENPEVKDDDQEDHQYQTTASRQHQF